MYSFNGGGKINLYNFTLTVEASKFIKMKEYVYGYKTANATSVKFIVIQQF